MRQLVGSGTNPNQVDETAAWSADRRDQRQSADRGDPDQGEAHLDVKDNLGNPRCTTADRNQVQMAQLLLDVGAAVDPDNKNGMTPLMMAASRGNIEIIQALLAKGAKVGKTDFTGRDALSWATEGRRPAVVQALQRAAAKR